MSQAVADNDEAEGVIAEQLRQLGWPVETIRKILRGPEAHSIDEIAGKQTTGLAEPPSDEREGLLPHAADNKIGASQKEIVDSLWALYHGDPVRLLGLVSSIVDLPGALQAYLIASIERVKDVVGAPANWQEEFLAAAETRRATESQADREKDRLGALVLSAAAQAASEMPVIGREIWQLLRMGLAIREALLWSLPLPVIKAASTAEEVEGEGVRLGISLGEKDDLDSDQVAQTLPMPLPRVRYPFTPSLVDFQIAATRLSLYAGQLNSVVPVADRFRWTIQTINATGELKKAHVFLSLHGLDASMQELELTSAEDPELFQSGQLASGTLSVKDGLGDIHAGSLRAAGIRSAEWTVGWLRITSLLDGKQWKAIDVGTSDEEGRLPLLKFERIDPPELEEVEPDAASDDSDQDEGSTPVDDDGPDQEEPTAAVLLNKLLANTPFWSSKISAPRESIPTTYEIFGRLGGELVPLTSIFNESTGLVPGGRVFVGNESTDGYGYAGTPGRGAEVFQGASPVEYGLDEDKPVVIFDGTRAWPAHAAYLTRLYGATWRKVIYQ